MIRLLALLCVVFTFQLIGPAPAWSDPSQMADVGPYSGSPGDDDEPHVEQVPVAAPRQPGTSPEAPRVPQRQSEAHGVSTDARPRVWLRVVFRPMFWVWYAYPETSLP